MISKLSDHACPVRVLWWPEDQSTGLILTIDSRRICRSLGKDILRKENQWRQAQAWEVQPRRLGVQPRQVNTRTLCAYFRAVRSGSL